MISVYHIMGALLGAEAIILLGLLLPIKFLNKLVIAGLWKTKYYLNGLLIFLVLFSAYETQHLLHTQEKYDDAKHIDYKDYQIELQMKMTKFRTERNWYLVIGTTVFMFLIVRIAALLAAHHEEVERLNQQIKTTSKEKSN